MHTSGIYERVSRQLIEKTKSHFMIPATTLTSTIYILKVLQASIRRRVLSSIFVSPIFIGRPRVICFSELINKVVNRITGSWKNLSFLLEEGGITFKQLSDVCKSFQYKQWWVFRSKQTLWGNFLQAKYFQRSNPIRKMWDTIDSQSWRYMMRHKHTIEAYIQWKIRSGPCSFWCDNWLGVGPLAQYTNEINIFNNNMIAEFMENGQWNMEKVI